MYFITTSQLIFYLCFKIMQEKSIQAYFSEQKIIPDVDLDHYRRLQNLNNVANNLYKKQFNPVKLNNYRS